MSWRPESWPTWLGLSTLVNLGLFVFFLAFFLPSDRAGPPGFWGLTANDTGGYLQPVEDTLERGDVRRLFGYRMFGYGLPYLAFRLFLSPGPALNALIVIQGLLAALAAYVVALLALRIGRSSPSFVLGFLGQLLVPFVPFYAVMALTESFTCSALALSVYFLVRNGGPRHLLLSGAFLTWCIFLRPVFFPLVALHLTYIAVNRRREPPSRLAAAALVFLAPLAAVEGTWVAGRYASGARTGLLVPTSFAPNYLDDRSHTAALIDFLKALGVNWSHTPWFYSQDAGVPCVIETSRFDCEDLREMQGRLLATQTGLVELRTDRPLLELDEENRRINAELRQYTESVRLERPLHYHVVAPLQYLFRIATASPTHRMFGRYATMNPSLRPFRLASDCVWWALQLAFGILAPRIGRRRTGSREPPDQVRTLLLSIVFYTYAIHALIFRTDDFRYVVPVVPLIVAFVASVVPSFARSTRSCSTPRSES